MIYKLSIALLLSGIILLSFNISGLFLPLRNSDIYQEEQTGFKEDITLTGKTALSRISKKENSDEEYVTIVNNTVNKSVAHYWSDSGLTRYNLRIPIYENYLLFFNSFIFPRVYLKYEFSNPRKAIERGVGLCSQQAIIVAQILKEHNINSKIVGLAGHVVAMAQVDKKNNTWWVLDPDYGVIIKHNIHDIEKNPEIIKTYYAERGYNRDVINTLIKIYGIEGNVIKDGAKEYIGPKIYLFEYLSYGMIWLIPIFWIIQFLLLLFWKSNSVKQTQNKTLL